MNANELGWIRSVRTWWPDVARDVPPLSIVERTMHGLFEVNPFSGVAISTDQAAGISMFAGIPPARYLRLCAMLGLTQWRVLDRNELLFAEDFAHSEPSDCLFVRRPCKADYALALERPGICFGCFEFYRCLGAEIEVIALADMFKSIQNVRADCPHAPALR